jgi:hypothetical protein
VAPQCRVPWLSLLMMMHGCASLWKGLYAPTQFLALSVGAYSPSHTRFRVPLWEGLYAPTQSHFSFRSFDSTTLHSRASREAQPLMSITGRLSLRGLAVLASLFFAGSAASTRAGEKGGKKKGPTKSP